MYMWENKARFDLNNIDSDFGPCEFPGFLYSIWGKASGMDSQSKTGNQNNQNIRTKLRTYSDTDEMLLYYVLLFRPFLIECIGKPE